MEAQNEIIDSLVINGHAAESEHPTLVDHEDRAMWTPNWLRILIQINFEGNILSSALIYKKIQVRVQESYLQYRLCLLYTSRCV